MGFYVSCFTWLYNSIFDIILNGDSNEFVVGGKEDGKQGRCYNKNKVIAVIVVELTEKRKIRRAYIKQIDSYSAKLLRPIFENHISSNNKQRERLYSYKESI